MEQKGLKLTFKESYFKGGDMINNFPWSDLLPNPLPWYWRWLGFSRWHKGYMLSEPIPVGDAFEYECKLGNIVTIKWLNITLWKRKKK